MVLWFISIVSLPYYRGLCNCNMGYKIAELTRVNSDRSAVDQVFEEDLSQDLFDCAAVSVVFGYAGAIEMVESDLDLKRGESVNFYSPR